MQLARISYVMFVGVRITSSTLATWCSSYREKHDVHLRENAVEVGTGRRMNSTFVGFSNDAFKNKDIYLLEEVYGPVGALVAYPSDLDIIATDKAHAHAWSAANPRILTDPVLGDGVAPESLVGFHDFPADHFPCLVDLTFDPTAATPE